MTAENARPSDTWMQRIDAPGRLAAFGVHISASIAVVGSIGGLMLWLWFPQPWFMHDGGWWVYQIILAVDVVLGPLLNLIVFRRGKPGLRRDMTLIVALQLGALAYGTAATAFRDITSGNNDVYGTLRGKYTAGKGWDACTGLGVPDGTRLLKALGG